MSKFPGRISEQKHVEVVKEAERKLIYALVDNGRAPLTEVAKKLRISKDKAHYALTKLQNNAVITHIAPIVDLTRLGYNTYHAFFVTNDANKERKHAFITHLMQHKHTQSVIEYTDRWEVEWIVVAKDMQAFDKLLTELITQYSDVVIEKMQCAIINTYKETTIAARSVATHTKKPHDIDEMDLKLLNALHEDGRASSYDIGSAVDLSPNAVRHRINKLTSTGIIRAFTATVNLNALDYHLYTVGIHLKALSNEQEAKLKEYITHKRFIIKAVKVLGHWDLILTIVADNIKHFHETIKDIEDSFAEIIINYEALIAFKEYTYRYIPSVVLR